MDQVTKNAPFGTDNTPQLEYKIIGGKRVEVVAKSVSYGGQKSNFGVLGGIGPHGTPPMQTQPLYKEYEYADLQKGYKTAKQHEVARKVSSYTSPFGDRTQSFRHGPTTLNKHAVLPPIGGGPHTAGNNLAVPLNSGVDLQNGSKELESSDQSLDYLIAQKLKAHPTHKISLKDMYIELSAFDRDMTGCVNENQLSLVVLRQDLPLKLSTLKILYRKFADPRDPRLVNYEKFLQFLSSCLAQSGTDLTDLKTSSSNMSSPSKSDKASAIKSGITGLLKNCTVDGKLVTMIKEQMSDSDDWDLAQLYTTLNRSDRLRNDQLSADIIMKSCVSERVPLTSSILTSMLQQAEIDHGVVNWRQFLAPLACAYLQLYPDRDLVESAPSPDRVKSPSRGSEVLSSATDVQSSARKESFADERSSTKVSRKDHLSAGWDERQPRGKNKPLSNTSATEKSDENISTRDPSWMRNFTRLAHALKSYHPYKTDQLPRGEVERMINNYNLIYSLGFSASRLSEAVKRSTIDTAASEKKSSADLVSIESLLSILLASAA